MDFIKVYECNSEEEALLDIQKINEAIGVKPTKNNQVRTYDVPFEINGKWYFRWDYFTDDIVGKTPIEINI